MSIDRIAVVGAGRVGLSLAHALVHSGRDVTVLGREARSHPSPSPSTSADWDDAIAAADLVLVAVPDDALESVAARLARGHRVQGRHAVLHTSGLHDRSALAALESSGAALGSWHPVQTFAIAEGEPDAFAGTPVVIEGDPRALGAGRDLAALLGAGPVVEMAAARKATYHAGAVLASNYLIVLASVAKRLAREAGADEESGRIYLPLMRRTLANWQAAGPSALTGPIGRGDTGTVARHLAALDGADRELYLVMGREALRLAVAAGLGAGKAKSIEELLY